MQTKCCNNITAIHYSIRDSFIFMPFSRSVHQFDNKTSVEKQKQESVSFICFWPVTSIFESRTIMFVCE